ncbi:MAG: lytic transglycosylase domain-containing protein [candidate division WOR-3 bacterium]|nr:MAG: lytic transglycosylase domain-containing protein [candidate division WOR-3 bacterium]
MIILLLIGQIISTTKTGNVLFTNIPSVQNGSITRRELVCADYDHIIKHYCQLYDVDDELVKLVIRKESEFNPRAVSRSGAIGLMQLMPETARSLGVKDPFNPRENIKGGVKYLGHLLDLFGEDLELALAAYHAGPGLVRRLNRVPEIPATLEYVDYILSRYGRAAKKNPVYFSLTDEGTPFFTNLPK